MQADGELEPRRADRLRQRAVVHLRQGGYRRVGADPAGQQAPPGEHPVAGLRRGRSLHRGGPLLHHGGLPGGEPDDRHGAGDQQLQGVLVRGEGGERHAALRAGAPPQALRGDDGPGLQAEHRRPARVAGEIHRLEGDAGSQQRRHPRGGAERAGAQRVQADRLPGGVRAGGHRGDARRPRPVQDAAPERRQDRPGLLRDLREVRRRSHRMEA